MYSVTTNIDIHYKCATVRYRYVVFMERFKSRRGSPVDCRPSTAEAPLIGKIHPFIKIDVTLEPVMQFGCPSRFRIS